MFKTGYRYILLFFFTMIWAYFYYSGAQLNTDRSAIMSEFYGLPINEDIKVEHYSAKVMRSGAYCMEIYYQVENSISADEYEKILKKSGWAKKNEYRNFKTFIKYEPANELTVVVDLKNIDRNKQKVLLEYFYE